MSKIANKEKKKKKKLMSRIANIIYCFREWDLQKVRALSSYHQALFNYIITELVQLKNLSNQISGNNR